MARSLEATETFRLQVIEQNSAHNTSTIKVPGYLEVTRKSRIGDSGCSLFRGFSISVMRTELPLAKAAEP
jgi:hypothetical protein